jgi:hypothetical protein
VDLEPVLCALPPELPVYIWNNAERPYDLAVLGRYEVLGEVRTPYVYTQDDDAICPVAELVAAYEGEGLLVNVPPGEHPWLAWGALFPTRLPFTAFHAYIKAYPHDRLFERWADVVFAHYCGWQAVDLGHRDLPWATAPDRMYHEPAHYPEQAEVRERIARLAEVRV